MRVDVGVGYACNACGCGTGSSCNTTLHSRLAARTPAFIVGVGVSAHADMKRQGAGGPGMRAATVRYTTTRWGDSEVTGGTFMDLLYASSLHKVYGGTEGDAAGRRGRA